MLSGGKAGKKSAAVSPLPAARDSNQLGAGLLGPNDGSVQGLDFRVPVSQPTPVGAIAFAGAAAPSGLPLSYRGTLAADSYGSSVDQMAMAQQRVLTPASQAQLVGEQGRSSPLTASNLSMFDGQKLVTRDPQSPVVASTAAAAAAAGVVGGNQAQLLLRGAEATPAGSPALAPQGLGGTPQQLVATPYFSTGLFSGWRSASKSAPAPALGSPDSSAAQSPDSRRGDDDAMKAMAVATALDPLGNKGGKGSESQQLPQPVKAATNTGGRKLFAVFLREGLNLLCAAASIAAAISSYQTLNFAATDVRQVVSTWQVKPLSAVVLVPSLSACPSNFTQLTPFNWPGATTLGCGCPMGASYNGVGVSSSSTAKCSSVQLSAGCVTNVPTGLPAVELTDYRGSKICYRRGLASYMEASNPDTAGNCGTAGTHKCGATASGTYSTERAQCVPDALGSGCPLTWLGSNYFFSQSVRDSGDSASQAAKNRAALDKLAFQLGGTVLFAQEQTSSVLKQQLPVIDLAFSFQQNDAERGPCYKGPSQSSYIYSSSGGLPTRPAPCTVPDARWIPVDLYAEGSLLGEAFTGAAGTPGAASAGGRCSSYSTLDAATESDYFKTGQKCNLTTSAAARSDLRCEEGITVWPTSGCASGDSACKDTFFQTRCGHLARVAFAAADRKVGLYMRQQTYWKESCPHRPQDVRASKDPFESALTAQYALLIVNVIMNGIQALVSVYLVFEKLLRDPMPGPGLESKANASKTFAQRLAKFAQVAKLPLIIASVVCVNIINSFYVSLSKAKCSDDMTNATFDMLGNSLPGVLYGNIATLVCDSAQVVIIPLLSMLAKRRRAGGGGKGVGPAASLALGPQPPTPAALRPEKIKVPTTVEGVEGLEMGKF